MSELAYQERPAAGTAQGLLVLHHGRGADEHDLIGLADALDPERRLHVVTPGGPLRVAGWSGKHWYVVPRVGFPDHDSFHGSYTKLTAFHDELWERTGIAPARTVFGGFSMGSVMSYAAGLGAGRPRVAGLLIFSGFIPTVAGWSADLPAAAGAGTRAFITHGRQDGVIDVAFARKAQETLNDGKLTNEYHEGDFSHQIEPGHVAAASRWLRESLPQISD